MPFAAEIESAIRQELRRGGTGTVYLWPVVDGENVAVTSPSATVRDPAGATLSTPAVTNTSIDGVSRLSVSVDATSLALDENYGVEFVYTSGAIVRQRAVGFDVVIEPAGSMDVSLNDLVGEQSDLAAMLLRQAQQQNASRTAEQQAALLSTLAYGDVRALLKRKVEAAGYEWPVFILNKEEIRPVVVARAVHRAYVAQGLTSEGLINLATFWREEAERRFAGLPELSFSTDTDQVEDVSLRTFGTTRLDRSWL